ncbi:MAG: hypothetical protein OHK0053_28240 [Microscillaceae bacterium]
MAGLLALTWGTLRADRITGALKQIEKGDFEKAREQLLKEGEKNPESAGLAHVWALYFFNAQNPAFHLDSAYLFVQRALKFYPQTEAKSLGEWSKEGLQPESAQALQSQIEEKAFEETKVANTLEAYQSFLLRFPAAPQIGEATALRNQKAWQKTETENTLRAYEDFMTQYPQAVQIPEATLRRDRFIFQGETRLGTLTAFERFVKTYPQNQFREEALRRIFYLRTLPHRPEVYEDFVRQFPESATAELALEWLWLFYEKKGQATEFASLYPAYARRIQALSQAEINARLLVAVFQNGLWGYCDEQGEMRTRYQFEFIPQEYQCRAIEGDFLIENRNGRLGLIAKNGQTLVEPQFDKIESLALGLIRVMKNSFSGLMHQSGRILLPLEYESIEVLNQHFLKIRKNRLWGLASYNGEIVVKPQFTEIEVEGDGFVLFKMGDQIGLASHTALFQMIADQNIQIKTHYEAARVLENQFVVVEKNGQKAVLDALGKILIPFGPEDLRRILGQGWAAQQAGKWRIYQNEGTLLNDEVYDQVAFGGACVGLKKEGKWGLLSLKGESIRPFALDSIAFIDHTALLFQKKKTSALFLKNEARPEVDLTLFKNIRPERGNYAKAQTFIYYEDRQGGKGLFDQEGLKRLSPKYQSVYALDDDLLNVQQAGKYGLVNAQQVLVLPIRYDGISNLEENPEYKLLLSGRKFGLYSQKNKVKIEPAYDQRPELMALHDTLPAFKVYKGNKCGLVDANNKTLLPFKYQDLAFFGAPQFWVQEEKGWRLVSLAQKNDSTILTMEKLTLIRLPNGESIALGTQNGLWGAWSKQKGWLISPQYEVLLNRGTPDRPLLYGERKLDTDNQTKVAFHNLEGKLLWQSDLSRSDYYRFICEE